ncbi:hypothetical protein ACOCEA_10055 [Maribacter sp. CXY002]|uniref:hypothetical protein n=1 Tax=Maribacter luteocoastalis TaxID=3407671 RepID=UPI003B67C04F
MSKKLRVEDRLKKWFEVFKDTLDPKEVAMAVLTQKELFLTVNGMMSEEDRAEPMDIDKFCDEAYINSLVRLSDVFKENWNSYFQSLSAGWKVELIKRSFNDSQPHKYQYAVERSFPEFKSNFKPIERKGDMILHFHVNSVEVFETIRELIHGDHNTRVSLVEE